MREISRMASTIAAVGENTVFLLIYCREKPSCLTSSPGTRRFTSLINCVESGRKISVFGKSHLDEIAAQFDLPILARLPIDPAVAEAYDNGQMETVNTEALSAAVEAIEKTEA